jgi:sporulation protein YlmC with PRC-barrel domain
MLQLSSSLIGRPVMSLRTGTAVAATVRSIINPDNLKIEGFYCDDGSGKNVVLLSQDIRDIIPNGLVVNDHDVLSEPGELVRLKQILDYNFTLEGKPVVTVSKQKVGKVGDYATDTASMYIQKLYITQSVFKSFSGGSLSIDRTQINEITPRAIIINDLESKIPARAGAIA